MKSTEAIPIELMQKFAAAAHALWCERMRGAGWRFGDRYDAGALTSPDLRPFAELPAFERDHLCDPHAWMDLLDGVCDSIDATLLYARGELRASDVPAGTLVRLTPGDGPGDAGGAPPGEVVDTIAMPSCAERLESIGVRWTDGTVLRYLPNELELVGGGQG